LSALKKFAIFCGLIIGVGYIAYKLTFPTFSFHVRLTIAVDDHGQEKSASSVIEETETGYPSFGGLFGDGFEDHARGEAVFLDLGNGNNLLALLGLGSAVDEDDIVGITQHIFFNGYHDPDYGTLAYGRRIVAENLGKPREIDCSLPTKDYPRPAHYAPTLAHFHDLADRKTIERVDPANASATLGPGIKFLRATLEITDDPVTSGVVEKRLPWLHDLIGDSPMEHLPNYQPQIPELEQDRIFYPGFVRK
jgi:hypothetical protein